MDPNLQAWQQRVVEEKTALDDKISKLEAFVLGGGTETFRALPKIDQQLLEDQHRYMIGYAQVLSARIRRFYDKEA